MTCMCLTYGRPHVVEEAIHSFLIQDYSGPKELVVLNDFDRQTLVYEHSDVVVVNVPKRFRTVGEKRNACAALASHELLFVWDDDDIFLPHRISYSVRMFEPSRRFFKPSRAFTLNHGQLGGPVRNLFHSGSCFARSLFDEARGYPHMGSGQDKGLELSFERILRRRKNFNDIAPEYIYYLYRWEGTLSYHLSGFGPDGRTAKTGNEKVADYVGRQIAEGLVPTGRIDLAPHWQMDYVALVKDYLGRLPPPPPPPPEPSPAGD